MTTPFSRTESAKWAQETQKGMGDLQAAADKALAEAAARGFSAPPGVTLAAILAAGQEVKGKLTEGNAKIYEDRRGVIFQQEEFTMKVIVQVAKLAMELYRQDLVNALSIEQAQKDALRDTGRADVERMNSEVDVRQAAIIRDRAEMERGITVLKNRLVAAEVVTLDSSRTLVQAQLETAEEKLKIIDSIYQVLAAEELVLAAERRRADTLTVLLAAQRVVANIKQSMVPFYIEKAEARQDLAVAITNEIPIRKKIEELGYDRITLKNAEEAAAHRIRQAEEEVEVASVAWHRAREATEIARAQSRRLLLEYSNIIHAEIMSKRKVLEENRIDFRLDTSLARETITINNDAAVSDHEVKNLTEELTSIISNINKRGVDEAAKVSASATQNSKTDTNTLLSRKIVEGAF